MTATETAQRYGIELVGMETPSRVEALRSSFDVHRVDALVISNPQNIRYLSGFTGSAGTMLVTSDSAILLTDGRYRDQAPQQIESAGSSVRVEIVTGPHHKVFADRCSELGTGNRRLTVGFEAASMTFDAAQSLIDAFEGSGIDAVPTTGVVEHLRLRKDPGELARMALAAAITDDAVSQMEALLPSGLSERDFGIELDLLLRKLGAAGPSFETIVASGPQAALPHARPSGRVIGEGELVVVDVGSIVDGYCSDMTRTLFFGELDELPAQVLAVVTAAQAAGTEALCAGVEVADVDRACREIIAAAGWADFFNHGTGHGVGLDVHEQPRVSAVSGDTLATGHVVTVEPGVYLPGKCGARVEDTLVITDDGAEALTLAPKSLPA